MFEDSLVESSGRLRRGNPWTTAASFTIQSALGGFVVLLSLFYTDALPIHSLISMVETPPPPTQQSAPAAREVKLARAPSETESGVLTIPREVPRHVDMAPDHQPPGLESNPLTSIVVPGAPSSGAANSIVAELLRQPARPAAAPAAEKVRVSSGVAQGLLIHQVKPQYPLLALQARVQGTVTLQATIGKDGTVQDLRVVSGHPLLTAAAIDAVKQWRYRPYSLNNEPVAVETQINVNFTLGSE